jgi:hypothetical protein
MQYPLRGPLKGVGPKIETFLGPETAISEASAIWTQKIPRHKQQVH